MEIEVPLPRAAERSSVPLMESKYRELSVALLLLSVLVGLSFTLFVLLTLLPPCNGAVDG
jgi:hypothetical protein